MRTYWICSGWIYLWRRAYKIPGWQHRYPEARLYFDTLIGSDVSVGSLLSIRLIFERWSSRFITNMCACTLNFHWWILVPRNTYILQSSLAQLTQLHDRQHFVDAFVVIVVVVVAICPVELVEEWICKLYLMRLSLGWGYVSTSCIWTQKSMCWHLADVSIPYAMNANQVAP